MKAKSLPSLEYLNECFELDPSFPCGLRWKVRPLHHFENKKKQRFWNVRFSNKQAGAGGISNGYYRLVLDKVFYSVHRLIYAIYNRTIEIDSFLIDHIDRNKLNNNTENLRACTSSESNANRETKLKENRNVYFSEINQNYSVSINLNRKRHFFSPFETLEEASAFAEKKRLELFGEFAISNDIFLNNECQIT